MVVSALGWDGPERRVYQLVRTGMLGLAISLPLLDELRRVLGYPKLALRTRDRETFLADVRAQARLASPTRAINAVGPDPADNRVLECAVAARVDWIVSGDRHLLELGAFEGIPHRDREPVAEDPRRGVPLTTKARPREGSPRRSPGTGRRPRSGATGAVA